MPVGDLHATPRIDILSAVAVQSNVSNRVLQSRSQKGAAHTEMPSGETRDRKQRSVPLVLPLVGMCVVVALAAGVAEAHVFVSYLHRQGAYPPHDGAGWLGEAFLNVPNFDLDHHALLQGCLTGANRAYAGDCRGGDMDRDGDVDLRDFGRLQAAFHDAHLLHAQRYVADREPDFTFRTDWIDFPAGPENSRLDVDFSTVGGFLDDYIYDVSDPSTERYRPSADG